jgi:hypothetical protein
MKIAPLSSDVNKQVQANMGIQSSYGKPHDFSRHLKNGTEGMTLGIQVPQGMELPEVDALARDMWGTAYDPVTHAVKLDQLAQNSKLATEQFARKLGGLLRGEGIETSYPIYLSIDSHGLVRAGGNHPQKQAIDRFFAEHPSLANEYQKISSDNHMVATGKLAAAYGTEWTDAPTQGRKQSIFSKFQGVFNHINGLSGDMHLSMDMLTSASQVYARHISGL